jgi:ABC-type molybdenum transport system ATPase subunit/photorepair protein PhrA
VLVLLENGAGKSTMLKILAKDLPWIEKDFWISILQGRNEEKNSIVD